MTTLVKPKTLFVGLALLCVLAIWLSLALGPVSLPLMDTLKAALRLMGLPIEAQGLEQAELILGQIRLPRTLLGLAVGGVLALSGVAMQGLFRNPLADPGLVGVSSGAALGAAVAIVGGSFFGGLPDAFGPYLLSLCAFLGGLGVTALVYRLGRRNGQTNVATMLLAGIALTALASSAVGLFTYLADDATLRTLTFWNLGSLNGASYSRLWPLLLVSAGVALWLPRRAKALNALLLGESEANHLGIDVEGLKRELVFCTALGVGATIECCCRHRFWQVQACCCLPIWSHGSRWHRLSCRSVSSLHLSARRFFFTCCCGGVPDATCGRLAHTSRSQNCIGGCHPRPVTGRSARRVGSQWCGQKYAARWVVR